MKPIDLSKLTRQRLLEYRKSLYTKINLYERWLPTKKDYDCYVRGIVNPFHDTLSNSIDKYNFCKSEVSRIRKELKRRQDQAEKNR